LAILAYLGGDPDQHLDSG